MTNDEIKIAVAEACGAVWKRQSCSPWNPNDDSRNVYFRRLYFIEPGDIRGPATLQDAFGSEAIADDHDHLPNYPADLNACASFREHLDKREQDLFAAHLGELTGGKRIDFGAMRVDCTTAIVWASSRQRCEAFLKVKGRWKP